jgi:CubicO group peptidase (beta-lactamase class C family)
MMGVIMKKSLINFIVLPILVSAIAYPQISSRKIDKLVKEAMETFNVAGIAVGIVKDGKVIHSKGYGIKSIKTNEPVDEHTNFAIASNTKAFTTAALSILVDNEELSWNDKVVDIIPEFKMYNDYVTQNFIIKDLVTHRSGLGLGAGDLQFWPTGADFTMQDILKNFQHFQPESDLRTKYDYDNILYVVAGEVIARVSGIPWEQYIKQYIFNPLGMDNSYCNYGEIKDFSNIATPHLNTNGEIQVVEPFENDPEKINGAAVSIVSNVDDLSKWMLVHLNEGSYGDTLEKELFSLKNHREMWKLHTVYNADTSARYNSHFAGYGLGWELSDIKGNMLVLHGGYVSGMLSLVVMMPDLNFGLAILTNTELSGERLNQAVVYTIIDKYLGLNEKDWITHYYERYQKQDAKGDSVTANVWATVDAANQNNINLEHYIGTYVDNWFGKVEIDTLDNQLWFKSLRSPKLFGPMFYYKANAFAIKWEIRELNADAFALFSLDEEGMAQSIKMKGISPNIDFSYDFQDLDLQRIE